jgi:hypothetical protein
MRLRLCLWFLLSLTAACLLTLASGCDLTLGPKTKTVYTLIHPGRPIQILDKATVTGRVLDGTGDAVKQDVGGWVVMPMDHFNALKSAAEKGASVK